MCIKPKGSNYLSGLNQDDRPLHSISKRICDSAFYTNLIEMYSWFCNAVINLINEDSYYAPIKYQNPGNYKTVISMTV